MPWRAARAPRCPAWPGGVRRAGSHQPHGEQCGSTLRCKVQNRAQAASVGCHPLLCAVTCVCSAPLLPVQRILPVSLAGAVTACAEGLPKKKGLSASFVPALGSHVVGGPRKSPGNWVGGAEHVSLGCPVGVSENVLSLSPCWSWGVPCSGGACVFDAGDPGWLGGLWDADFPVLRSVRAFAP